MLHDKESQYKANADLTKDGVINAFDLAIIAKNIGQVGASGAWTSPIPKAASFSVSLIQSSIDRSLDRSGHWILGTHSIISKYTLLKKKVIQESCKRLGQESGMAGNGTFFISEKSPG